MIGGFYIQKSNQVDAWSHPGEIDTHTEKLVSFLHRLIEFNCFEKHITWLDIDLDITHTTRQNTLNTHQSKQLCVQHWVPVSKQIEFKWQVEQLLKNMEVMEIIWN